MDVNLDINNPELKDLFQGCILGVAIGDALGMPTEGMGFDEIRRTYGFVEDLLPSPLGDLKAGEWTDDTEQMIILAESIVDRIYLDPDDFASKLVSWAENAFKIRSGQTTRQALRNLLRGVPWDKAGVDSATCGAAMRVAPIGLVYHFNLDLVERYAVISASVTHKNDSAFAGAVAVSMAISTLISDFNEEEMLAEVISRSGKYDPLLSEKISYVGEIRDAELEYAVEKLGNSIMVWDVVPMAFYCVLSSKNFSEAVKKGANAGGDTDSIAAIAGAISGAKFGVKEIPENWKKSVKDSSYLLKLADQLYQTHMKIVTLSP
ncbi:MAG: ADP-ribosylglycohydrolase family protein [Archaeoglobus sp.]|nr:ADP-ribosylglycohydrolase family protein [Archaeoglobus sp.]